MFSLVLAIAVVALVRVFSKEKSGWGRSIAVAWVGVLSHILLDLTNNYGVRLLAPFSGRWFEWDCTYVVDPYLWAALILALALPLLGRLLSSEIGGKKRAYPTRAWGILALTFVMAFNGARVVLHSRATAILNARLYNGEAPQRVAAFPTPLNPLDWEGLVELSDRYYSYELDVSREFHPDLGRVVYKNNPGPARGALEARKGFGALIEFAQYPAWKVIATGSQTEVRLTDLRFGDPVQQTFTCSAVMTGRDSVATDRCDFTFAPHFGR